MRPCHSRWSRWLRPGPVLLALCVLALAAALAHAAGRDDWQQPDRVMEDLHLKPGARVADVGCGKGYCTFRIAKAVGEEGKVWAVDIDEKALQAVQARMAKDKVANVETIKSEPTDTKLEPECADAALVCLVLHHVPEQQQPLLLSIAKSLKPGGLLFVVDFRKTRDSPHHSYEQLVARDEATEKAEAVGLTLDAEWYYLKHQYFLRFRKPEDWQPPTVAGTTTVPPLPERD